MVRQRVIATGALIAAVTAGAVGGALIGVPSLSGATNLSAASSSTTVPGPGSHFGMGFARGAAGSAVFDAAAQALRLTPEQLRQKLSDGKTTIADVAKDEKVDINTVIAAMDAASHDRNSKIVNQPWPQAAFGGGFGPGSMFKPRLDAPMLGASFDALAKALNMSAADLQADLAKGMSIKDIAQAQKVDLQTVINTLVTNATTRINDAVKNKKITQQQADKLIANLKTRITNMVNNGFRGFGFGGMRGHMRFGFPGFPGGSAGPTP